jgi:hypothetical protein
MHTDSGTLMRLTIDELLILAPRLQTYLTTPARSGATSSMPPTGCAAIRPRGLIGPPTMPTRAMAA